MEQPQFSRLPQRQRIPAQPASRVAALLGSVLLAAAAAAPATAADVGVSVHVSQPGTYGRIDIGRVPPPPPALVYAQPILVQPPPRVVAPPQPVYLWVPPGHQKNWGKHCARYGACGVPVYFVQDRWYRDHVMASRGGRPAGYAPAPGPGYGPGPVYAGDRGYGHGYGHGHGDKHAEKEWRKHGHDDRREQEHGRKSKHGHGHD